jgi:hypothetical protein
MHDLRATHARFMQVLQLAESGFDFQSSDGLEAIVLLKESLIWFGEELRRIQSEWTESGHL